MAVPVVDIRVVAVAVNQLLVLVDMVVGLPGGRARWMLVPVVLVVVVNVAVDRRLVDVLMLVALRDVQPRPAGHQEACGEKRQCDRLAKQQNRRDGTSEWPEREVGSRSRGPQVPEREHEQGQTHSVACKADCQGRESRGASGQALAKDQGDPGVDGSGRRIP